MKFKSTKKVSFLIVASLTAFVTFFTLSVRRPQVSTKSISSSLPVIGSLDQVFAIANRSASDWDGVRSVATLTKAVVDGVNEILEAFYDGGLFSYTGNPIDQTGDNGQQYRLDPGFATQLTGPLGSATYQYSFEVWSDSSKTTKLIEFFFNNPSSSDGGEVMLIMNTGAQDATVNTDSRILCQAGGTSGSRSMICQFTNNSGSTYSVGEDIDRVLIKVAEADGGDNLHYTGIARTLSTNMCGAGAQNEYYSLAFIATAGNPHYTTARHSLNYAAGTGIDLPLCETSNEAPAGFFNANENSSATDSTQFYVGEGSTVPSSSYPAISDVNTLHSQMEGSSGDITKTTVDALSSISFQIP